MSPLSLCRFCVPVFIVHFHHRQYYAYLIAYLKTYFNQSFDDKHQINQKYNGTKRQSGQPPTTWHQNKNDLFVYLLYLLDNLITTSFPLIHSSFIGQFIFYLMPNFLPATKIIQKNWSIFALFSEEITIKKISKKSQKISKNRNLHFNFSKNLLKTPFLHNCSL